MSFPYAPIWAQNLTDFTGQTMRVDFYHLGDAKEEMITLDRIYEQGPWAGSRRNLLDPFGVGRNLVKVYDALSKIYFSLEDTMACSASTQRRKRRPKE